MDRMAKLYHGRGMYSSMCSWIAGDIPAYHPAEEAKAEPGLSERAEGYRRMEQICPRVSGPTFW